MTGIHSSHFSNSQALLLRLRTVSVLLAEMRPLELLKVIFGALSRDDLDALMLANASFRDIVLRDFAKKPFRYVSTLCIHEYKRYGFVITKGNEYRFWDNDDFSRRMRLARDGSLE